MVPLFMLADEGHVEEVPHGDTVQVQTTSSVTFEQFGEGEEDIHSIGDGHTDHSHVVLPTVWWKNTMWWTLFLISLFMMTVFSYGVYKYLEDKPLKTADATPPK